MVVYVEQQYHKLVSVEWQGREMVAQEVPPLKQPEEEEP